MRHHWKPLINPESVLQVSSKKNLSVETNTVSVPWKDETILYFYQLHISSRLSFKKAFKIQLQSSGLRGITEQGTMQRD